jgi:hypothetical protein
MVLLLVPYDDRQTLAPPVIDILGRTPPFFRGLSKSDATLWRRPSKA